MLNSSIPRVSERISWCVTLVRVDAACESCVRAAYSRRQLHSTFDRLISFSETAFGLQKPGQDAHTRHLHATRQFRPFSTRICMLMWDENTAERGGAVVSTTPNFLERFQLDTHGFTFSPSALTSPPPRLLRPPCPRRRRHAPPLDMAATSQVLSYQVTYYRILLR